MAAGATKEAKMQTNSNSNPTEHVLAYERLDAYRIAIELLEQADQLAKRLPRTKGQLGDQLQRASESIVLRIAEGAGCQWRSAEQKRHFRAARASVLESAAVIDICRVRRIGTPQDWASCRELSLRLVQMLTRLALAG
jgi:four helix bundle protein